MDSFGICLMSMAPVRATASDKAEMVTQILFGELAEILESKPGWYKIRMEYDDYEGWMDQKQLKVIPEELYQHVKTAFVQATLETAAVLKNQNTQIDQQIVLGSSMPKIVKQRLRIGELEYFYDGRVTTHLQKSTPKTISDHALRYLGTPYLWGGRSPFGIDCSGLVQMAYKLARIRLPRDAAQQAKMGEALSFVSEAEPGDLAFFDDENGKIVHVGIMLNDHEILHASGSVRIDTIDHNGIFIAETKTYSHKLRVIKRIL